MAFKQNKKGAKMVLSIVFYEDTDPSVFQNNSSKELTLTLDIKTAIQAIQSLKKEVGEKMNGFGFKQLFSNLSKINIHVWKNRNGVKMTVIDIEDTEDRIFALPMRLWKDLGIKQYLDLLKGFTKSL